MAPRSLGLGLLLISVFASTAALQGCASSVDSAETSDDELKYDGGSYKWIYNGPMPALEEPSVTVSLSAHTARVSGFLPASFTGVLPFYAESAIEDGRTKVAIVYPIATGAATNAPGSYKDIIGLPYVITNAHAAWGGFPFLEYNHPRGIALHGPITHEDAEWRLIRGPVSHGCNRMQGEHVVEVARLIGIDMTKPHLSSERDPVRMPVKVSFDVDTWQGQTVDVDYPAMASVKRPPAATSKMFKIWESIDLPRMVCKYNKTRPLGANHCDYAGTNKYDVASGPQSH